MNINRTARLSFALLALLSFGASAATPPDTQPSATASAAAAIPSVTVQAGAQQDQPSITEDPRSSAPATPSDATPLPAAAQTGQQGQSAAQSHQAPPAVAAQAADATPKEQAAVVAQVASPSDASGFRLMTLSTNALLSRVSLADQAERELQRVDAYAFGFQHGAYCFAFVAVIAADFFGAQYAVGVTKLFAQ